MKTKKTATQKAQEQADRRQQTRVDALQQVLAEMRQELMKHPDNATLSLQMNQSAITIEVLWWDKEKGALRKAHAYSTEYLESWSATNLVRSLNRDETVAAPWLRADLVVELIKTAITGRNT